jgi:hypothetical protein
MPSASRRRLANPTIRDVVRRLGGPAAVGRYLGIHPDGVSMWAFSAQGIPQRHHLALWRLAVERGVDWRPPGAEGLRLVGDMTAPSCSAAPAFPQCSHDSASDPAPAEVAG